MHMHIKELYMMDYWSKYLYKLRIISMSRSRMIYFWRNVHGSGDLIIRLVIKAHSSEENLTNLSDP